MFHLLTHEASSLIATHAPRRKPLRLIIRRAFVHAEMAAAAKAFEGGTLPQKLEPALNGEQIQPQLREVASCFVELQQARHQADYDVSHAFTRAETLDLVELAEQAFRHWQAVKGTIQADTFLIALLITKRLRGEIQ